MRRFLNRLRRIFRGRGRVLYVGHCYYNAWYLSRALRKSGWRADVLNWDPNEESQGFYHGEDYKFDYNGRFAMLRQLWFYFTALFRYDIFHFSNAHGLWFGFLIRSFFLKIGYPAFTEIKLLKKIGKIVVYSNNGCLDGVSQTAFRSWASPPVCDVCPWRDNPGVCSDERNLEWGGIRNSLADYQILLGGNRADYNLAPTVHEVPEFYCLDPDFWRPDLEIPVEHRRSYPADTVKLYHAVGNFDLRTEVASRQNVKSTHIYFPLVKDLQTSGYPVELMFIKDIPSVDVRFYQAQADIVVDMLTYGFFGANVREAMILGKPAVCYLRPEWLDSMREEIPEYVDELPVVSATPETIRDVLIDLIEHPEKREEIGRRSREFAIKWHSADAGARRIGQIYSELLGRK